MAGLLAATLARLCEGQVSEVHTAFDVSRSEQAYFATILDKTASLMATACRIGGLTARLDRRQVDALTTFGECFGMVFQIRDDILDVIATEEELGKGVGQDMERGVYTLPVLRSLGDSGVGPELRSLLGRPLDRSQRDKARDMVASSGGIASAVGAGRRYADMAAVAAGTLASGSDRRCAGPAGPRPGRRHPDGLTALGAVPAGPPTSRACRSPLPPRAGRSSPGSPDSGRRVGKAMTSRMLATSPRSMTSRSIPIPRPAVGGRPYSRARR